MEMYERMKIPIIFTGPHSYDASPIELLFAAFKKGNLNTRRIKTGKKYVPFFSNPVLGIFRKLWPLLDRDTGRFL